MNASLNLSYFGGCMYRLFFVIIMFCSIGSGWADTPDLPNLLRGKLLYETHCEQCHTQQIHWRNKAQASDMKHLINEVGVWQRAAGLEWTASDIEEVSRYLNSLYYHYP